MMERLAWKKPVHRLVATTGTNGLVTGNDSVAVLAHGNRNKAIYNMKRHLLSIGAALLLAGTGTVLATGCGGGSNDSGSVREANGFVTRAEEDKYSSDALILASREATDAPIPTSTAVSINEDLAAIRAQYPALTTVNARPLDDLKSVLVVARASSPVGQAWAQGKTATGVAGVDDLLTRYKVESVKQLTSSDSPAFVVRFVDPLNTRKVLDTLEAQAAPGTSGLISVSKNLTIGGGNQITRTGANSTRVYEFVQGWGDCLAGCINKHKWTVTLDPSGTMRLEESGTPLPAEPAF